MPKKEPSLFRIAVLLVGIAIGTGSLKLGIPQALAGYFIAYISDGMMNVNQREQGQVAED